MLSAGKAFLQRLHEKDDCGRVPPFRRSVNMTPKRLLQVCNVDVGRDADPKRLRIARRKPFEHPDKMSRTKSRWNAFVVNVAIAQKVDLLTGDGASYLRPKWPTERHEGGYQYQKTHGALNPARPASGNPHPNPAAKSSLLVSTPTRRG